MEMIAGFFVIPKKPFFPKSKIFILNSVGIPAFAHAFATAFSTEEACTNNDLIFFDLSYLVSLVEISPPVEGNVLRERVEKPRVTAKSFTIISYQN